MQVADEAGRMPPQPASGRPRVAWLTFDAPDRDGGGGQIRQSYLLEGLAAHAEVDLYLASGEPDAVVRAAVRRVVRIPAERRVGTSALRRRLHTLWMAQAGPEEYWVGGPARARLRRGLGPGYEAVVVEAPGLLDLVRTRRPGQHWFATVHNVGSERARQQAATVTGRRQAWAVRREALLAARAESRLLPRFDAVIAVSDGDAARLPVPATTVPNGVDVERFTPSPLPQQPSVVLTGTLGYLPNVDGVAWFVEQVWPRVRARVPAVTLSLVGRRPVPSVLHLHGRDGITVTPDVPRVAPYLHAARVAVVPLRIGSGTRLKALDAMACGRPVVGTTAGLEGLAVVDGVHALVRDDPAAFADAVVGLLEEDVLATALAEEGRRFVEEHHGWGAIARRFAGHVLSSCDAARG